MAKPDDSYYLPGVGHVKKTKRGIEGMDRPPRKKPKLKPVEAKMGTAAESKKRLARLKSAKAKKQFPLAGRRAIKESAVAGGKGGKVNVTLRGPQAGKSFTSVAPPRAKTPAQKARVIAAGVKAAPKRFKDTSTEKGVAYRKVIAKARPKPKPKPKPRARPAGARPSTFRERRKTEQKRGMREGDK